MPIDLQQPFIATFCTALTSTAADWRTEAGAAIDTLKVDTIEILYWLICSNCDL